MKNMRGIIDPYTLGFLIAIAGLLVIAPNEKNETETYVNQTQKIQPANQQGFASNSTGER